MGEQNSMHFNISKFNVIKFGRNHDMKEEYNYFGPDTDEIMIDKDKVWDLGVTISPDCNYKTHISKVHIQNLPTSRLPIKNF